MNKVNNTPEYELDNSDDSKRLTVDLLVNKVYTQLLTGVETYQHFRWRLERLNEVHLGIIDQGSVSGWLAQILKDVKATGESKDNPYPYEAILKELVLHLKALSSDEVKVKLDAMRASK